MALSSQVCVAGLHEVTPVRHGSGFVAQASPAVQAEQVPALQTGLVTAGRAVRERGAESTQTDVPVEQEVVPATHGFGFPVQATPAAQVPQTPPLQTWLAPQTVPFGSGASGSSTHVCVPVEHDVVPPRQASAFVGAGDARPCRRRRPPRSSRRGPCRRWCPAGFAAPSTQTEVPVAQDVTP